MSYSLDTLQKDCYENTTVLKNKFGIKDQSKLDIIEQDITSALIAKAFLEFPFKNVDFNFYKSLHKYVFSDIYEWAGKIRDVDMSKKSTKFCVLDKIEEQGENIFKFLRETDFLRKYADYEFINEFTDLYCRLNYLHPFREGNGRIQRLFLAMLVRYNGKKIDFSEIDTDLLMIATIKSITGDIFMLRDIFRDYIE